MPTQVIPAQQYQPEDDEEAELLLTSGSQGTRVFTIDDDDDDGDDNDDTLSPSSRRAKRPDTEGNSRKRKRTVNLDPMSYTGPPVSHTDMTLPPLPPLSEPWYGICFTHKSAAHDGRMPNVFEDFEWEATDNEAQEFLGDSLLKGCIALYLCERWPHLRQGPCTAFMNRLVSNDQFSEFSKGYNFHRTLTLGPQITEAHSIRSSRTVQAGLFEAYCAGVYLQQPEESNRMLELAKWIWPLITPVADVVYGECQGHFLAKEEVKRQRQLGGGGGASAISASGVKRFESLCVYMGIPPSLIEWRKLMDPHRKTFGVELVVRGRSVGKALGRRTFLAAREEAAGQAWARLAGGGGVALR